MAVSIDIGVITISRALQDAFGNSGQFPKSIYDSLAVAIMEGVEVYVDARIVEVNAAIASLAATIPPPAKK